MLNPVVIFRTHHWEESLFDNGFIGSHSPSNSSCGRQRSSGTIVLANASRPISTKELNSCKTNNISFIKLPISVDIITAIVNPANSWENSLTIKTSYFLKKAG